MTEKEKKGKKKQWEAFEPKINSKIPVQIETKMKSPPKTAPDYVANGMKKRAPQAEEGRRKEGAQTTSAPTTGSASLAAAPKVTALQAPIWRPTGQQKAGAGTEWGKALKMLNRATGDKQHWQEWQRQKTHQQQEVDNSQTVLVKRQRRGVEDGHGFGIKQPAVQTVRPMKKAQPTQQQSIDAAWYRPKQQAQKEAGELVEIWKNVHPYPNRENEEVQRIQAIVNTLTPDDGPNTHNAIAELLWARPEVREQVQDPPVQPAVWRGESGGDGSAIQTMPYFTRHGEQRQGGEVRLLGGPTATQKEETGGETIEEMLRQIGRQIVGAAQQEETPKPDYRSLPEVDMPDAFVEEWARIHAQEYGVSLEEAHQHLRQMQNAMDSTAALNDATGKERKLTWQQAEAIVMGRNPLAEEAWYYEEPGGRYGDRTGKVDEPGATNWHAGLDLFTNKPGEVRIGTPLYSSWHGTVVEVPEYGDGNGGRGEYVCIKLDEEIYGPDRCILMQHMDRNTERPAPGTQVVPGDIVGAVGNSGVGPELGHLHIEVMIGGITTDPENPGTDGYFSVDPLSGEAEGLLAFFLDEDTYNKQFR